METEAKTLREMETSKVMVILEQSETLKLGTEEHSRAIDDIVKLSRAINEDYKTELDMYHQDLKTDSEIKRAEEEIKVKREQMEHDKEMHNTIRADSIFMMSGFALLTIGACVYEVTGGHIIPKGVLQFANYIPRLIKV